MRAQTKNDGSRVMAACYIIQVVSSNIYALATRAILR